MNSKTNLKIALTLISTIAIISIGLKIKPILNNYDNFNPEKVYKINYRFFFKSGDKNTSLKTYIPSSNSRQRISKENIKNDSTLSFTKKEEIGENIRAIWNTKEKNTYHSVDYEFVFEGKDRNFRVPKVFNVASGKYRKYLKPTQNIQSDNEIIDQLATQLLQNTKNDK